MEQNLDKQIQKPIKLVRTLDPISVILMGIGALIGGGIFTLLGHAIGLAGPAVILSMAIGAFIAFLNLQMYISLSTTFPGAGGGYMWTRLGLGKLQGFLSGWISWFANSSACGLYSLSFGYYFYYLLFDVLKIPNFFEISQYNFAKIFAILAVLFFGYINYKGTKLTGKIGNYITVSLLLILLGFIVSGFFKMGNLAEPLSNFKPFLPYGIIGIISAAAFFYIAFEGSEIQVQTAEEIKNPSRDLKIALFVSWTIVSLLYILIAFVVVGATYGGDVKVWEFLNKLGEGAIIESARQFMPLGVILMIIGGILANIAALNATIFSSSHVSFAMARDKAIFEKLSSIHQKFFTPHLALISSLFLILLMIIFLPLYDVGAAASLLFILLFLQLNIAGIQIYRKKPETKWVYKVPFFPITPILAVIIYTLLALTMLKVNLTAWLIVLIWLLFGLVNFFAYSKKKEQEEFEREIAYEKTLRLGEKKNYRVLVPLAIDISIEQVENLVKIAFAIAKELNGELIFIRIHEVPDYLPLSEGAKHLFQDKNLLDKISFWIEQYNQEIKETEKQIAMHSFLLVSRNTVETILEVIKRESCDLLILNWEGYTLSKGFVFGSKIDKVLRELECDLLITKVDSEIFNPKSIFLAVDPDGKNPHLKFMGKIINAIAKYFSSRIIVGSFVKPEKGFKYNEPNFEAIFNKIRFLPELQIDKISLRSTSIVKSILNEGQKSDLIILGATQGKILRTLRVGNIPETVIKHSNKPVFIIKGHKAIIATFFEYLKERFF